MSAHARCTLAGFVLFVCIAAAPLPAEERFSLPVFKSGYERPAETFQTSYRYGWEMCDGVIFLAVLGLGAWLLLKRRSRAGVMALSLFSLLYFGFLRHGCICPVGSVQNVWLALLDPAYAVPLAVVIAFLVPLLVALVAGRVFCGSACPLGALQDWVLLRPLRLPRWLTEALGLLRFFVLGLALYAVCTMRVFPVCLLDPFVGFFRLSGPWWMLLAGAVVLLVGTVIGRPYCRFCCPYGGLLALFSRWPTVEVAVTPDICINCTLCDNACPFGAIERPRDAWVASAGVRLALLAGALVAVLGLGILGHLADGRTLAGAGLGLWCGLVIGVKLLTLGRVEKRESYTVNQAECLSCGRCYASCPRQRAAWEKKRSA